MHFNEVDGLMLGLGTGPLRDRPLSLVVLYQRWPYRICGGHSQVLVARLPTPIFHLWETRKNSAVDPGLNG